MNYLLRKQKRMLEFCLFLKQRFTKASSDSQFKIDGFNNLYQVDRNQKGGGSMLLFRGDLPVKVLSVDKSNESCYVEVILTKTKRLIN